MAVARDKAPEDVRVIYAPLDLAFLIRRVMKRLEPRGSGDGGIRDLAESHL